MKFSLETQSILITAYMRLYDAFVDQHLSQGKILAQSQHDAKEDMRQFLAERLDNLDTPAIAFLTHLFVEHKPVIARKTMESDHKNDVKAINPIQAKNAVTAAKTNLDNQILIVNSNPNAIETSDNAHTHNPTRISSRCRTFRTWLALTASRRDINELEHNPEYFAKIYRKFIMSQKQHNS